MQAEENRSSADFSWVTRLTPNVPAGIATLAVEGPQALVIVSALVELSNADLMIGRIRYGHWSIRDAGGQLLGREQVVVCRTAASRVEVHCHGGNAVCNAILRQLVNHGCVHLNSEEWPSEFGRSIESAAQTDLLAATTDRVAVVLLEQLQGALARKLNEILRFLQANRLSAAIDALNDLMAWSGLGQKLIHPWRVVLAGPPNVGKSSLLNCLVGREQAIVHAEEGTTRDWLESPIVIDGWPFLMTDTAGLRSSTDDIESEGIRRALLQVARADLVVLTVDATRGIQPEHQVALETSNRPVVVAWNKVDLLAGDSQRLHSQLVGAEIERMKISQATVVQVSATGQPGVEPLAAAIIKKLIPEAPSAGQAIPFRPEQASLIRAVLADLRAGNRAEAVARLSSILEFATNL